MLLVIRYEKRRCVAHVLNQQDTFRKGFDVQSVSQNYTTLVLRVLL